ncbi:sensor histidine kinase [Capnocytophaga sp. H4358]|uniref:sensor histidine kinase n=1 Tax=Capnocytophaga sp. H4358 TaxID=1945658 RepID=UPI0035109044
MKSRIIFKIILGYVLLISVSFITGYIIYNQIQKLTFLEEEGIYERRKVLKISKILTLMNETESAGKIAIRTDDEEALNFFLDRNYALQDSIIKFKKEVKNSSYVSLFDSVQILLELKSENLQELKILQSSDSSSVIIRNAIEKLSSLEPTLGYFLLNDNAIAKKKRTASKSQQTLSTGTSYASIIQKYKNIKIPPTRSQQKFDNTVLETLQLLNKVHEETIKYKDQQSEKIHTLWHTDNLLSDKLHQLLSDIEDNILKSAQEFNEQRQAVFEKSRSFLTISYVIALLLMVVFSFIVINDFWKIQRIRQKLEVANLKNKRLLKSREQLISMVSHDLRTPLSSIIGYTELLDNQSTNEKTKNYLSNIKHASDYITKLVDELLDYSKIEAGKISLEKVPLNVSELIEEVATNIYSIHKSKPVELIFNFSENVQYQWFSSDPYRIKQILYNLISNAFKFTDKGKIRITTTEKQIDNSKFEISISVSDTGIGIKKEQQAHIFDEFTQANQEVSKQYGGSGLGLHISQNWHNS